MGFVSAGLQLERPLKGEAGVGCFVTTPVIHVLSPWGWGQASVNIFLVLGHSHLQLRGRISLACHRTLQVTREVTPPQEGLPTLGASQTTVEQAAVLPACGSPLAQPNSQGSFSLCTATPQLSPAPPFTDQSQLALRFSPCLMLRPQAVVTLPHHKIISLPLHNCNFPTVMNHNANIGVLQGS